MQRPATDIAAVLAVIKRRDNKREAERDWRLDLQETDLRGADLSGAYLMLTGLTRANLATAKMSQDELDLTYGEDTKLPEGFPLKRKRSSPAVRE